MKKAMAVLLMSMVVGLVGTYAWAGSAREDTEERLQNSVDVLHHEVMATPDKGIPEEVLSNAKCILVVPNLIKGGFIVGGKHGRGVASCRTPEGWSAPAFDQGFQHLLSSKFELTGEGSVAGGPVGRHASAGTDWKMNMEVLTYSRSKGVFAGLPLEGAVVEQDNDSTHAIYGSTCCSRAFSRVRFTLRKAGSPS
jgi:lipid-binding SYLF domain-containing protein